MNISTSFLRILLSLWLAALCGIGNAQTKGDASAGALIVPGTAVAGLALGATQDAVRGVLGQPSGKIFFAEEKQQWEKFGYDLSKELPFILGFDELWTYTPSGGSQIPIWKVYFQRGKVNFIVVSDFVFANAQAAVKGGAGLGSTSAQIKKAFPGGTAYVDSGNYENLVYDDQGVTFLAKDGLVRVIQVYKRR
jgi:hypothetical protein